METSDRNSTRSAIRVHLQKPISSQSGAFQSKMWFVKTNHKSTNPLISGLSTFNLKVLSLWVELCSSYHNERILWSGTFIFSSWTSVGVSGYCLRSNSIQLALDAHRDALTGCCRTRPFAKMFSNHLRTKGRTEVRFDAILPILSRPEKWLRTSNKATVP